MPISLVLNGHPTTLDVDPRTPLLWALREAAGLTGPKYGCDTAQCGACTVQLDGQASLSCALTVADAADREVTTIEGIAGAAAEAVRTSWRALQVVECGYCQPGQMMSAIALLEQSPQPARFPQDVRCHRRRSHHWLPRTPARPRSGHAVAGSNSE